MQMYVRSQQITGSESFLPHLSAETGRNLIGIGQVVGAINPVGVMELVAAGFGIGREKEIVGYGRY